jgi:hypothetical protein
LFARLLVCSLACWLSCVRARLLVCLRVCLFESEARNKSL